MLHVQRMLWVGKIKERDPSEKPDIDGIMMLQKKRKGIKWNILKWLKLLQNSDIWRSVVNRVKTFGYNKMRGISVLA